MFKRYAVIDDAEKAERNFSFITTLKTELIGEAN